VKLWKQGMKRFPATGAELRQCKGRGLPVEARWRRSQGCCTQSHPPAGVAQGNPNGSLQLKQPARQNPHDVTTNDHPSGKRKFHLCLHFIHRTTALHLYINTGIVTACSSTTSGQNKPLATSQAPPRHIQELFSCLETRLHSQNVF
jgi:hypothetical protein